jgi:VCBS repeat-containing protein
MRAPIVLPTAPGLVTLVQAGRTVTLSKPAAGTPDLLQVAPGETLDFSRITNEQIALVKLGNRLVVLFADRSYVVVDGLYLPDGNFTPNVKVALDNATVVDTAQFAQQFSVSGDEQILTAAGVSVGPRGSGSPSDSQAPTGSAANPESALTLGDSGPSSTFGALTPATSDTTQDAGTGAANPTTATTPAAAAAPTAVADAGVVTEAGVGPGNAIVAGSPLSTGNVLTNDSGSSTLTVTGVAAGSAASASGNVGAAVAGTFGTLNLAADGAYSYALNNASGATQALAQGTAGADSFTYTITDATGQASTTTVAITVNGTNDAPVVTSGAAAASGSVTETGTLLGVPVPGTPTATGTLTATDVDTGATMTWAGNAVGTYGNFFINATTGAWTYTIDEVRANSLNTGETRTESFTATVTDEFGATAQQVVTVTVNGANDTVAPVILFDLDTGASGTGYVGAVNAEAARSTLLPPANFAESGVSLGQTDETSNADPRPNAISVALANPGDTITSVVATITSSVPTGQLGVLRASPGLAGLLGAGTIAIDDNAHTLTITNAAGYTQAQITSILATLRFVNTDQTFDLDMSDRTVSLTITDQNGVNATAIATIPMAANVSDVGGNDGYFTGGRFDDRIIGGDGSDNAAAHPDGVSGGLFGGDGNDYIDGGDDDDKLDGGSGNNTLIGGRGGDLILAGDGNNTVFGDVNGDKGGGDDTITVGNGNNTIDASAGDDIVTAGNGVNTILGGDGLDSITVGDGANTINAGAGDDTIVAGAGNDRITGGTGEDRITTGAGQDTIVFDTPLAQIGRDTLIDFTTGTDRLELSLGVVGGAGTGLAAGGADTGTLDDSRFVNGPAFTTANQRFLFDGTRLFYDADGSGGGLQIQLAQFENGGTVTATDIRIA